MPRVASTRSKTNKQTPRAITIPDDNDSSSECEIVKILAKARTTRPKPRQRNANNPPRAPPRAQPRTAVARRRTSQATSAASSRVPASRAGRISKPTVREATGRRRNAPLVTQPRPRRQRIPPCVDLTELPSSSEDSDSEGIEFIDAATFQRAASLHNTPEHPGRVQLHNASAPRPRLPTPDTLTISDDDEERDKGDESPCPKSKSTISTVQRARSRAPLVTEPRRSVRAATAPPRTTPYGLLSPPLAPERDHGRQEDQAAAIKHHGVEPTEGRAPKHSAQRGEASIIAPKVDSIRPSALSSIVAASQVQKNSLPTRARTQTPQPSNGFAVKLHSQTIAKSGLPRPGLPRPHHGQARVDAPPRVIIKQESIKQEIIKQEHLDDMNTDSEEDDDPDQDKWDNTIESLPIPPPRSYQFPRAMRPTIDRLKKRIADGTIPLSPLKEALRVTPAGRQAIRSEMERRGISSLASYNTFLADLMREYSRLLARSPVPLLSMMTRSMNDLQDECLELAAQQQKAGGVVKTERSSGGIVKRGPDAFNIAEVFPDSDSSSEESSDDSDDEGPSSLDSILAKIKKEEPKFKTVKIKGEAPKGTVKEGALPCGGRSIRVSSRATTAATMHGLKKRSEATSKGSGQPPKPSRNHIPALKIMAKTKFSELLQEEVPVRSRSSTANHNHSAGSMATPIKRKRDAEEYELKKKLQLDGCSSTLEHPLEEQSKQRVIPIAARVDVPTRKGTSMDEQVVAKANAGRLSKLQMEGENHDTIEGLPVRTAKQRKNRRRYDQKKREKQRKALAKQLAKSA